MNSLYVVFRVGGDEYILAAKDVLQMESYTTATRVPGAPAHVAGLVQVRGRVVPVVDLRTRFGLAPIEPTLDARVVVTQVGARTIALKADQAREVLSLAPEQLEPPPRMIVEQANGYVTAVARIGARIVMLLDVGKVVGEEPRDGQQ